MNLQNQVQLSKLLVMGPEKLLEILRMRNLGVNGLPLCPTCNSGEYVEPLKDRSSPKSLQKFRCKKCRRSFDMDKILQCPNCFSRGDGIVQSEEDQYYCEWCGEIFNFDSKLSDPRPSCPICGLIDNTKLGKIFIWGNLRQRYQCKSCGKAFFPDLLPKEKSVNTYPPCPSCNNPDIWRYGISVYNGLERFRCKKCGKVFTVEDLPVSIDKCPNCQSIEIINKGKVRYYRQIVDCFQCKKCLKEFTAYSKITKYLNKHLDKLVQSIQT